MEISIHSPRAGGDENINAAKREERNFNPLPPCGGRRRPAGRSKETQPISIHSPRAGGDRLLY